MSLSSRKPSQRHEWTINISQYSQFEFEWQYDWKNLMFGYFGEVINTPTQKK